MLDHSSIQFLLLGDVSRRASATPRTESRNTMSRMSMRPDTRATVHNQSVMGGQCSGPL